MQLGMIVGVYLLGILLNTFLYGLVLAQFLTYFNTKSNDPRWIRAVVWALLCTDTVHSLVEIYAAWQIVVCDYGNLANLSLFPGVPRIFIDEEQSPGRRHLRFKRSRLSVWLPFTGGIMAGVINEVSKLGHIVPFAVLWLSFQSITDFIITVSLVIALARASRRTGFPTTDTIINRLIRGAMEYGNRDWTASNLDVRVS
ncbi:hypothetical protein B0H11DRAFT_12177 [Mycena galericulata]|nr:hypothetical protein B0H11DRAFT_12177 [Mycena galericulata]